MQSSTAKTERLGRINTGRGSKWGDGSTSGSNPMELLFLFNLDYKFILGV